MTLDLDYDLNPYAVLRGDHRVLVKAPRAAYDELTDNTPIRSAIWDALGAVLNLPHIINGDRDITVKSLTLSTVNSDWKQSLRNEMLGEKLTNQGINAESSKYYMEWNGLRFRSRSEARIAEAFDKQEVLYFPKLYG